MPQSKSSVRAHHIGNARRRGYVKQIYIRAGCCQSGGPVRPRTYSCYGGYPCRLLPGTCDRFLYALCRNTSQGSGRSCNACSTVRLILASPRKPSVPKYFPIVGPPEISWISLIIAIQSPTRFHTALNSYILSHILEFTQDNTAFLQKKRPSGDRRFCFIVLYLVLLLLYYSIVSELYQNSSRSLPAILLLGRRK